MLSHAYNMQVVIDGFMIPQRVKLRHIPGSPPKWLVGHILEVGPVQAACVRGCSPMCTPWHGWKCGNRNLRNEAQQVQYAEHVLV